MEFSHLTAAVLESWRRAARGTRAGKIWKILVVDDDRELGDLLVRLFHAAGYAADLARDGQAGLHFGLTSC